ncbi:hypothetical protein CLU79DRAFT_729933 [Phycomyces nitens]|nr:hypothetical protein CLU79DRAFT_729933 [Phycomyces nitens]
MSINPIETFYYTPFNIDNDTDMPCISIPLSDELYSYVDYRGPTVIDQDDLDLIGNCSRMSYCDKRKRTCQPKRPVGSHCRHNMECYFGMDGFPGHCTNQSVCSVREGLPAYYYTPSNEQWTVGDQWQSAVYALVITGVLVTCLIFGRQQASRLGSGVRGLYERLSNRSVQTRAVDASSIPPFQDEASWHHYRGRWWKKVPGFGWVYKRFKREPTNDDEAYLHLTRQERVDDPPPYRG